MSYRAPKFGEAAYNCPHCGAYAQQTHFPTLMALTANYKDFTDSQKTLDRSLAEIVSSFQQFRVVDPDDANEALASLRGFEQPFRNLRPLLQAGEMWEKPFGGTKCAHCEKWQVWLDGDLIYPMTTLAPTPDEHMPDQVRSTFLEAAQVGAASPRSAAALLRLAIEQLVADALEARQLERKGHLDTDIGTLVQHERLQKIQQALDSVRLIGNDAVHPGSLNVADDPTTVSALFLIVNLLVEKLYTEEALVEEIYNIIPEDRREKLEKRRGPREDE